MIDVRFPIGFFFTVAGGLLIAYGLTTLRQPELYQKSLGTNVNFWAGGCMLAFGLILLVCARGARESK